MSEYEDFDRWNELKKKVNDRDAEFNFRAGQVWWCALGKNVGFEEDGKHERFERPVLIIRKVKHDLFIGAPLTLIIRDGDYFYTLPKYNGKVNQVLLVQIRAISSKRLLRYIRELDHRSFREVVKRMNKILENETPAKRRNLGGVNPQLRVHYNKPSRKSQGEKNE